MPRVTERTAGMRSVRTRRPPGSSVRSNPAASRSAGRLLATSSALLAATGVGRGVGRGLALLGQLQGDAVLAVDLHDLDEHLVADVDDVLDGPDPLALLAEAGDVKQPVLARGERDEGPEGGRLDPRAQVALADLGHDRVHLLADHLEGGVELVAVGGPD